MKKYIVIYHAPMEAAAKMADIPPEEAKKGMEAWFEWQKNSDVVDIGTPLANGMEVTKGGTKPSTKQVVGYSILEANSMDEAVEKVKNHPHLAMADTCSIEVHEELPLPGM